MTTEQNEHVKAIADEFSQLMADKYAKGDIEHKGNLWEVASDKILDYAIEEAIDQVVYLLTLKQQRSDSV